MEIDRLMRNLEQFINDDAMSDLDPLIKMAVIHHQFESIHPFYDGNGRAGRIILILYLVTSDLLDLPVLYLSRYITRNKGEYYHLLQDIRDHGVDNCREWINWVLFMLRGVEKTAEETIGLVKGISGLMAEYKRILKPMFGKLYKHELLNNLFFHPYTKIGFVERDMMVQRKTAAKYLNSIVEGGLLRKVRKGAANYYVNERLMNLLSGVGLPENAKPGTQGGAYVPENAKSGTQGGRPARESIRAGRPRLVTLGGCRVTAPPCYRRARPLYPPPSRGIVEGRTA